MCALRKGLLLLLAAALPAAPGYGRATSQSDARMGVFMNLLGDEIHAEPDGEESADLSSLLREIDEAFRAGDTAKAMQKIEDGLGRDPFHPSLLRKAGVISMAAGNEENARRHFSILRSLRPDDPEVLTVCAMLAMRPGETETAAKLLQEAWALDQRLSTQFQMLVLELVQPGFHAPESAASRPFGVEEWLTIIGFIRIDPERYEALLGDRNFPRLVSRIFGKRVSPSDLEDLAQALRTHLALTREGRWRQARTALERAKSLGLQGFGVRLQESVILFELGRPDEAIQALRVLAGEHPDFAPSWYNLGLALLRDGRYANAAEAFENFLLIAEDHPAGRFALATSQMGAGEREVAWDGFNRLARTNRDLLRDLLDDDSSYLDSIRADPDYDSFARKLGLVVN
jgi:tetratricopeptide (TPR) repeat protein